VSGLPVGDGERVWYEGEDGPRGYWKEVRGLTLDTSRTSIDITSGQSRRS